MATVYHRDQAGAPALVYSTATNNIAHFTALKTVLKACLINGYGAQPSAGWLLINEGVNFIVLRTGTLSGYVCLTWVVGGIVRVYLAETYTGMTGDVMTGDGLKSGNASASSLPQVLAGFLLAHSTLNTNWAMVADSKTFVFMMVGGSADEEIANLAHKGFTLYAGEDSSGAVIALGGSAYAGTNYLTATGKFSGGAGMTVLKSPVTGLLVGSSALDVVVPGLTRDSTTSAFSQIVKLSTANLLKAVWAGGAALSGSLRGVALVADLANTISVSQAAQCLGLSTAMTYRTANTPINLGDGHMYFAGVATSASFFLLTDNPDFW